MPQVAQNQFVPVLVLDKIVDELGVVGRAVAVRVFEGGLHAGSPRLDLHPHNAVLHSLVGNRVLYLAQQRVGRLNHAVSPMRGRGQPELVSGAQAVQHLGEHRHRRRRSRRPVTLVHNHAVPFVPVLVQVQPCHRLNRGEGHALAYVDLSFGDGSQQVAVQVQRRPVFALVKQVPCVGQPQRFHAQPLGDCNAYLGLSTPGRGLENTIVRRKHCLYRFLLIVVKRYFAAEVDLLSLVELSCMVAGQHRYKTSQATEGYDNGIAVGFIHHQLARGFPGIKTHLRPLDVFGVVQNEIVVAPRHDFGGRVSNRNLGAYRCKHRQSRYRPRNRTVPRPL